MSTICATCGLPSDLCVCEDIAKESQRITVLLDRRKFGKEYTVIEGIDSGEIDVKDLSKKLKHKFACGGTAKGGQVSLQGNHLNEIADALIDEGFAPETIDVKR